MRYKKKSLMNFKRTKRKKKKKAKEKTIFKLITNKK